MQVSDINDRIDAVCYLTDISGRAIVTAEAARAVAGKFDVPIYEGAGKLQPINEIDRASESDKLGIGIGDLVRVICEHLDLEPVPGMSAGHGAYQDELKRKNLPKLKQYVSSDTGRWYVSNEAEEPVALVLTDIDGEAVERKRYSLGPTQNIRLSAMVVDAEPVED